MQTCTVVLLQHVCKHKLSAWQQYKRSPYNLFRIVELITQLEMAFVHGNTFVLFNVLSIKEEEFVWPILQVSVSPLMHFQLGIFLYFLPVVHIICELRAAFIIIQLCLHVVGEVTNPK